MAACLQPADVASHNTRESCWIILHDTVYDATSFLPEHPGGSAIILKWAGKDATAEFDPIHQGDTLERCLIPELNLGKIRPDTSSTVSCPDNSPETSVDQSEDETLRLQRLLNLDDIEAAAKEKIPAAGWAYYYGGSRDLITKSLNGTVYQRIFLRPRIFLDTTRCDPTTSLLGHTVGQPFFVSPAARGRLAHPAGENGIARGISHFNGLQIISNHSSQSVEQIVENSKPGQIFGWQIYMQKDKSKSKAMLDRIHKLPAVKFLVITLDVPVATKREMELRVSGDGLDLSSDGPAQPKQVVFGGVDKSLTDGKAADMTWGPTLKWLTANTALPIVLKGVQTYEDALMASKHPEVKAIILSNHGGRALDTASMPVHVLLEIRRYAPEVFEKLEVWVDGGIKRGSDVVKALCLGARGVGLGRAPLYGLAAGGPDGVKRVFEILRSEIKTTMQLLGAEKVSQLNSKMVNATAVENEIYGVNFLPPSTMRARL